ncbi:MAG: hypothetical protein GX889_08935 [Clostridiales bacterium]|nr:hypothetical protein [Clostridiales bacterium]
MKNVSKKDRKTIILIALLSKVIEAFDSILEEGKDTKMEQHKNLIYSMYTDLIMGFKK